MDSFKDKIRAKLADMSGVESDFDALTDIVGQQLDDVSGGFPQFSKFTRFTNTDNPGPVEPVVDASR
jgi:hypothetical protein